MLSWASQQFERISQQVAPPPDDGASRFAYMVQKGDEAGAMGAIAGIDPVNTVVNQSKGTYPIHLACQYSMAQLIQLLLSQPGATMDVMDANGNNPMHYAAMSTQLNALEVIKTLISDYNASVTQKNGSGKTPYDMASIDSVRQYLLPIQLQAETQFALDNGGVGLPPGIDLGGLKIQNSNMPPPPTSFGGGPPAASAPAPPPMQPFGQPSASASQGYQQHQPAVSAPVSGMVSPAPASMPVQTSHHAPQQAAPASGDQGYARVGSSSAAIYSQARDKSRSFVRPDGFHSSSSDVSLQKKYGHHTSSNRNIAPPPASGGSISVGSGPASGGNPFAAGNSLATQRYGSLPPSNQRYVNYGPTSPAPVAATQPSYQPYAAAPSSGQGANTFVPQNNQHQPYQQQPTQGAQAQSPYNPGTPAGAAQATPSAQPSTAATPSSPFMPPPPYSSERAVSATPAVQSTPQPSFSDLVSPSGATVGSEPRTPSSLFSPQQTKSIGESATQLFGSPEAAASTAHQPTQAAAADPDALPEGWSAAQDPSTGQTYYYNSITNETRWERPEAENGAAEPAQADAAKPETNEAAAGEASATTTPEAGAAGALPEGWMETQDPSSGATYYFNSVTNETSWERPAATPSAATNAQDSAAPQEQEQAPAPAQQEWMETQDPATGNTYYFNTVTNETSWERPASYQPPSQEQPTTETQTPSTTEADKPELSATETAPADPAAAAVAAVTPSPMPIPQKSPIQRGQSAEELFSDDAAAPIEDEEPSSEEVTIPLKSDEPPQAVTTPVSTPAPATLQRAQSAEELFGDSSPAPTSVPVENVQPAAIPTTPSAVPPAPISGISTASSAAEELFGGSSHNEAMASPSQVNPLRSSPTGSAKDLFEAPSPMPEPMQAMPETPNQAATTTSEAITSPVAVAEEPKADAVNTDAPVPESVAKDEPAAADVPLTTSAPEPVADSVAAPAAQPGSDLFAAIGMPPPPFQPK
eukprot:CAMPEP_0119553754 /NCGR_PEP_ID=MMETSP1352-20130426/6427_1 /TAXON_ID=265584 /ORGANISM="Stauroneis constricta, Strain CCMP1120" /LENGTH=984 /DNA_ID=CAMNT_0007600219 /DNA_START=188 /DNA_END=3142 /DNA_ORIENTATION=+